MIHPVGFEQKIAFDTVRQEVEAFCLCPLGRRRTEKMRFETDYNKVCAMQEETDEFRRMLLFESTFPSQDYFDLTAELKRLQMEGTFIDVENLHNLRASLLTVRQCLSFFSERKEQGNYPRLTALSENMSFDFSLIDKIDVILDAKGMMRDTASEELQSIRKQIRRLEATIQQDSKRILQQSKQNRLIDETADITIRNGRFVLPVPAVNKRKIKGVVHDVSSSGQTFFIEPQEIFEANNLLNNLLTDERQEMIRVLIQFSNYLRPLISSVLTAFDYLGFIDFTRAKAKFALLINACKPIMLKQTALQWKKAIHPLLYLSYKEQHKTVVPLDIELGYSFKILIISGPNAGGKSVCLKTLALLQYMFQCGLLVSVSELSEFGIFDDIFIDIGDEQSIDNDLSTYSSHLKNMQVMATHANERSLFLIDELGGGTDPQYGGAIAEALLEYLSARNACGLVTTHFGNLKLLAEKHQDIENGAMLFDEKEMRPLFVLKTGQFGTSFTFEIAEKTGLNKDIIRQAMQKAGKTQIRYEKLLQKLEQKQMELDQRQKMMTFTDTQLAELIQEYRTKNTELQQKRSEIIRQARNEAKMLVGNANKLIEKIVREIKESKADKEVVKTLRQEIVQYNEEVKETETEKKAEEMLPENVPETETVSLFDTVLMKDTHAIGEVSFINGEDVVVSFNSVNLRTTVDKIEKISSTQQKKIQKPLLREIASINAKAENFKLQLDLRGMRAGEAIASLEQYLDDALLLSIHQVSILHGKGNGILRMAVREHLARNKEIKNFYDEHVERGGHGITVVELH
ncbi:MAG: Smr/MutS family protein [Bacteroidales bacterium]|jgi:DNA mismatch repair protein MutS2|nr:Smr/MutS family protein [Bacteroidales bacterium]